MSALLAHAKAFEALAEAAWAQGAALAVLDPAAGTQIQHLASVYRDAADRLRAEAKAEASGPAFEDRPQQGRRP